MATQQSADAKTQVQAKSGPIGVIAVTSTFTFAGEAAGEIIQMVKVPAGATIVSVQLAQAALGASVTLIVGDGGSTNRFITATTANTALVVNLNAVAGVGYQYTADDTIDIVTAGGAATGAVSLTVTYSMDA